MQKLKVRYHPKNKLKMKVLFKYLHLLSLSTSGALLLCIVFAANPEIAEGTITGKVFWFHFSILLLAFSVLFMEATVKKSNFTFSLPDGLLLLFAGLALLTYNYELDPEPERLLFAGQITTLWFMLRATLQAHPELRLFFLSIIICTLKRPGEWGNCTGDHRQTIRCSKVTDLFSAPVLSPDIWQSYFPYA